MPLISLLKLELAHFLLAMLLAQCHDGKGKVWLYLGWLNFSKYTVLLQL